MSVADGQVRLPRTNSPTAELAFTVFQRLAYARISKIKVTWPQARRFSRTVERNNLSKAVRIAHEMHPEVGKSAEDASRTDKPKQAFEWLAKLLKAAAVSATLAGGVLASIHVVEEVTGREFHEIVDELKSNQPEQGQVDDGQSKPDKKQGAKDQKKPPKTDDPIDV